MTGHLGVVAAMDALFERVAGDPASCGDELLSAWLQDTLASLEPPVDKALAREVRKAARLAGRLARFWSDPDRSSRLPADWQQAVDAALGSTGWEPSLEVARMGLDAGAVGRPLRGGAAPLAPGPLRPVDGGRHLPGVALRPVRCGVPRGLPAVADAVQDGRCRG